MPKQLPQWKYGPPPKAQQAHPALGVIDFFSTPSCGGGGGGSDGSDGSDNRRGGGGGDKGRRSS